jgi:hypothetical protein
VTQTKSSAKESVMTESEILSDLEFVVDRLLELREWDCSKKIECIKNYIVEQSVEQVPISINLEYEFNSLRRSQASSRA